MPKYIEITPYEFIAEIGISPLNLEDMVLTDLDYLKGNINNRGVHIYDVFTEALDIKTTDFNINLPILKLPPEFRKELINFLEKVYKLNKLMK